MKTVFLNRLLQTIFLLSLFIVVSCSKDENGPSDPPISGEDVSEFNVAMAQLGQFDQPAEASQPEELGDPDLERDQEDQRLECSVQLYKVAPGFDEMLTLDPSTDVIYPGAVLKGETIPTGEYVGINLDRKPITLSASLTNITGSPVVTIENPKLSTVREGIKQILDQEVTGATAAKVNFEITQIYSEQHLDVAIGVNYRGAGKKVSANIDFSNSQFKNKFVLKFLQQYYTIDMDSPGKDPSDLFTNLPDVSALGSTSPVYVASVAYGRMVIYTIETNSSITDVNAAFSASVGSNDGTIDVEYQNIINESKIKALIIGGSGEGASQTINGPADVYRFISEGGNYSKDSPGAPLSYKLRYIRKDFPIARQVLATEYPIRTCYEAYQKFGIGLHGFNHVDNHDEGGALDVYGFMEGEIYQNGSRKDRVRWSHGANPSLKVQENEFYEIGDIIEVELYKPDLENDYINITAEFYEVDNLSANEHFKEKTRKILLKNVQATQEPYIRMDLSDGKGSDFRTYFYVWRVY